MVKAVDLIEINKQLSDAITSLNGMKATLDSVISSLDIPVAGSPAPVVSTELPPVQQVQQPSFGPNVAMQAITSQVAQPPAQEVPECFGNYLETDAGCIECDLSNDCASKTAGTATQSPQVVPGVPGVPGQVQVEVPTQAPQAVQAAPVHAAVVPSSEGDEQLLAGLNEDKRALVRDVANTSNIPVKEAMEALGLK